MFSEFSFVFNKLDVSGDFISYCFTTMKIRKKRANSPAFDKKRRVEIRLEIKAELRNDEYKIRSFCLPLHSVEEQQRKKA